MQNSMNEIIDEIKKRNPDSPEFIKTVNKIAPTYQGFLQGISTTTDSHHPANQQVAPGQDPYECDSCHGAPVDGNAKFDKKFFIEFFTPDRVLEFDVDWTDDAGNTHTNRGYRVQFSNVLGPYKGGLRFHPTVNADILKSLALEQVLKNSMTTLDLGGAKGGADFDPHGKSDAEVQRFCDAFMGKLHSHIGAGVDVPAGDIGVGAREIKFLQDSYLQHSGVEPDSDGNLPICQALTGKAVEDGGSLCRKQATGYGLVYFVREYLQYAGEFGDGDELHKTALISGSGNVAIYAAEKCQQLGIKVLTMSDSSGYVYDPDGIDLDKVKEIKEVRRGRISEYVGESHAKFFAGQRPWNNAADMALPCATQNEIELQDARALVANGVKIVAEGSNLSTTADSIEILREAGITYLPGKASNAGGVAVSGLEMIQNAAGQKWSFEKVDARLQQIMHDIFANIRNVIEDYNLGDDYLAGANISGFLRVASEKNQH